MNSEVSLNFYSLFTFIGIFIGLIISYYFIKNGNRNRIANVYQGLLLLTLSLGMLEEFLNESGYIVRILALSNFAEPLNFVYAPLFYLYIKRSLKPEFNKTDYLHFLVFLVWLGNMMFYFTQTNDFKYNSYVEAKHPDWAYLAVSMRHNEDPLGIRNYTSLLLSIHFISYMFFAVRLQFLEARSLGTSLFKTRHPMTRGLRNTSLHFILIILLFITVKLSFRGDIGDSFISLYITFMIVATTTRIIQSSSYFKESSSFLDFPLMKYKKSSLTDEAKNALLDRIELQMNANKYFLNNMASLGDLARILKETTHHVSQVINEKLKMNFFELLAFHRVEEAKKIIGADTERKVTIEDLADRVGYNSKSAFNNAFKKLTGQTPSEYREKS